MLTAQELAGNCVAIPSVSKEDLKRFWLWLQESAEALQSTSHISCGKRILSDFVQSGSDPLAVFAHDTFDLLESNQPF
jgi:hypothetical protein